MANKHYPTGTQTGSGLNDIDSNFADLLTRFKRGDFKTLEDLLTGLGISQQQGLSGSQRDDWNKQLLESLLNYRSTQENREYNESLRDEQRLYDLPLNQLARLMASGVSRDAAIQMLAGGSAPIQSDAASIAEGIPASESKLNGISSALEPIKTAFDAVSSIAGLVSLGFNIPQAIQQTNLLKNQNILTSKQIDSYKSASAAFSVLNSIGAGADAFGSVASASAAIMSAADGGNSSAQRFIDSGQLSALQDNAYFGSKALASLYKSEREASDYDTSFGLAVRRENAEYDWKVADKNKIIQATMNLGAELDYTLTRTAVEGYSIFVMDAQIENLKSQGKLNEANALLAQKEALKTHQETRRLTMDNDLQESIYNAIAGTDENGNPVTGKQALTHSAAVAAYNDMQSFICSRSKKIWESELNALAMNNERLLNLYTLQSAYAAGAFDKYSSDPEYQDFLNGCAAFNECGAWHFMQAAIAAYGSDDLGTALNGVDKLGNTIRGNKRTVFNKGNFYE